MASFLFLVLLGSHTFFSAFFVSPIAAASDTISLVYIEANTGGGSGGHLAIRIDESVFHFQYHLDGFFRLKRDSWRHFRLVYNDLENRSLFLAETLVGAGPCKRLKDRLSMLLLAQDRNFANLDILKDNYSFLKSMQTTGHVMVSIRALGLFKRRSQLSCPEMARLRQEVLSRHGRHFFDICLNGLDKKIRHVCQGPFKARLILPKAKADFVPLVHTSAQQLAELVAMEEAYRILDGAIAVKDDVFMDAGRYPPCFLQDLIVLRQSVKESITRLLNSNRPDKGPALLVELARFQALERSIETGHLIVLDPFHDESPRVSSRVFLADRASMEMLHGDLKRRLSYRLRTLCVQGIRDEVTYNGLENLTARMVELERGLEYGLPVRISDGIDVPCRKDNVVVGGHFCVIGKEALDRSNENYRLYLERLREIYSYDLIDSNCVTELLKEIRQAFVVNSSGMKCDSAYLDLVSDLSFVPFMSFRYWVTHMAVRRVVYMPSFRKRSLSGMYEHDNSLKVYLRESNTLTSSIYRPKPEDTSFLFFTDDVFLARPFFGAINTAWGILNMATGLVFIPIDHGSRFGQGFWGMLYSLPELVFSNIRKGSFTWTGVAE